MLRTGLVADQLLVVRNFVGAVIGGIASSGRAIAGPVGAGFTKAGSELSELGAKIWLEIKDELPKAVGSAVRVAPLIALETLASWIAGPVTGIASAVPVFKPIANAIKTFTNQEKPSKSR